MRRTLLEGDLEKNGEDSIRGRSLTRGRSREKRTWGGLY